MASAQERPVTVAAYILKRLAQQGVDTLFGVPGATCDPVYTAAQAERFKIIVTATDLEAGYAADGYARMKGMSAVAVTYGVGTLSLVNAIAGAYVERSAVVVINGGPTVAAVNRQNAGGYLFSHSTGKPHSDLNIFREVTAAAVRIERLADVRRLVDETLTIALRRQRPVYIEIADNVWAAGAGGVEPTVEAPGPALTGLMAPTGREAEIAREMLQRLTAAERPALLLGIEIDRFGLADAAQALVARLGVPWASTQLAKSVIPENTPGFIGVYRGANGPPAARRLLERADLVIALGCVFGVKHGTLIRATEGRMISVRDSQVPIPCRTGTTAVSLRGLMAQLQALPHRPKPAWLSGVRPTGSYEQRRASLQPVPSSNAPGLSNDMVYRTVSDMIDDRHVAITDTNLGMVQGADMVVRGNKAYVCNAIWQSIGFSVPAALGVGLAQSRRPIVICGDGGFQMTAQAMSSLVRYNIGAIVLVLDNSLYAIEQYLLDARFFSNAQAQPLSFLTLNPWDYAGLAKAMRVGLTADVKQLSGPDGLVETLQRALAATGPALITCKMRPKDLPADYRET
jgi:indolepyruvate decarboxylase